MFVCNLGLNEEFVKLARQGGVPSVVGNLRVSAFFTKKNYRLAKTTVEGVNVVSFFPSSSVLPFTYVEVGEFMNTANIIMPRTLMDEINRKGRIFVVAILLVFAVYIAGMLVLATSARGVR